MDGSLIITETLAGLSVGFIGIVSVLIMGLGFYYLGKAIWIIVRRRKY